MRKLKALVRCLLFWLAFPFVKWYAWSNPIPGYKAWVDLPGWGCLAFMRDDGTLQFDW